MARTLVVGFSPWETELNSITILYFPTPQMEKDFAPPGPSADRYRTSSPPKIIHGIIRNSPAALSNTQPTYFSERACATPMIPPSTSEFRSEMQDMEAHIGAYAHASGETHAQERHKKALELDKDTALQARGDWDDGKGLDCQLPPLEKSSILQLPFVISLSALVSNRVTSYLIQYCTSCNARMIVRLLHEHGQAQQHLQTLHQHGQDLPPRLVQKQ